MRGISDTTGKPTSNHQPKATPLGMIIMYRQVHMREDDCSCVLIKNKNRAWNWTRKPTSSQWCCLQLSIYCQAQLRLWQLHSVQLSFPIILQKQPYISNQIWMSSESQITLARLMIGWLFSRELFLPVATGRHQKAGAGASPSAFWPPTG